MLREMKVETTVSEEGPGGSHEPEHTRAFIHPAELSFFETKKTKPSLTKSFRTSD